jgi:acetyl-CoA carboxylase carboxyltransferase component
MHPFYAAERGLVDDVIDPADTRAVIVRALSMLGGKRLEATARKHGNPPA